MKRRAQVTTQRIDHDWVVAESAVLEWLRDHYDQPVFRGENPDFIIPTLEKGWEVKWLGHGLNLRAKMRLAFLDATEVIQRGTVKKLWIVGVFDSLFHLQVGKSAIEKFFHDLPPNVGVTFGFIEGDVFRPWHSRAKW